MSCHIILYWSNILEWVYFAEIQPLREMKYKPFFDISISVYPVKGRVRLI